MYFHVGMKTWLEGIETVMARRQTIKINLVGMKTCLEGIETSCAFFRNGAQPGVGMKTCLEGIKTEIRKVEYPQPSRQR